MRSQIIALGLAGTAIASYAPPAYEQPPTYGAETTSTPAAYPTTSAPAYEHTPEVPSYGHETSTSEYKHETTSAPSYGHETSSVYVPEYPTKTEEKTYWTTIPCESTTVTYGPSTYTVHEKTTLTVPVTKEYPTEHKSTPVSPEKPTYSVDVPVYTPAPSSSMVTKPVTPYYPTHANNATMPAGTGSPSATASKPAQYEGSASKAAAGAFLGFSGLLAALFL